MVSSGDRFLGWSLRLGRVEYKKALGWQRGLVKMRHEGMARDTIIMLEHPSVVTVGRNGHNKNFKDIKSEVIFVERGGDVTYHGPGQLVVYFIFNLTRRGRDLHLFMTQIQTGIIKALAEYKIEAGLGDEYTGVWVKGKKVASVGIAVKNWITYHGAAINISTELDQFKKINPCGLDSEVMTTASGLAGRKIKLDEFGDILMAKYSEVFETDFDLISLDFVAEDVESQSGGNVI